jgi:hypothetical protein
MEPIAAFQTRKLKVLGVPDWRNQKRAALQPSLPHRNPKNGRNFRSAPKMNVSYAVPTLHFLVARACKFDRSTVFLGFFLENIKGSAGSNRKENTNRLRPNHPAGLF